MTWKDKILHKGPRVGDKYISNPYSDKSRWSVNLPRKGKVFILEYAPEGYDCKYKLGTHHMTPEFLKEHFIRVN